MITTITSNNDIIRRIRRNVAGPNIRVGLSKPGRANDNARKSLTRNTEASPGRTMTWQHHNTILSSQTPCDIIPRRAPRKRSLSTIFFFFFCTILFSFEFIFFLHNVRPRRCIMRVLRIRTRDQTRARRTVFRSVYGRSCPYNDQVSMHSRIHHISGSGRSRLVESREFAAIRRVLFRKRCSTFAIRLRQQHAGPTADPVSLSVVGILPTAYSVWLNGERNRTSVDPSGLFILKIPPHFPVQRPRNRSHRPVGRPTHTLSVSRFTRVAFGRRLQ